MLRRAFAAFILALEFLTIVRLRRRADVSPRTVGESLSWFPAVGALIGALLVAVDWAGGHLAPPAVAAGLVVTASVVVTGALHLDGLADSADGLFGGHTVEQRLEIMKDSRTGTFGVVAIVLALLLTYAALVSTPDVIRRRALFLVPIFARFGMAAAVVGYPYMRRAGLGRLYKDNAPRSVLQVALMFTGGFSIALGWLWFLGWIMTLPIMLLVGQFIRGRLGGPVGGLTGDSYGAIAVVTEVSLFTLVAALASHPWFYERLAP